MQFFLFLTSRMMDAAKKRSGFGGEVPLYIFFPSSTASYFQCVYLSRSAAWFIPDVALII